MRDEDLKYGLLTYAVGTNVPVAPPGQSRRITDPVYLAVLEGRKYRPPSSSCGDLAHWFLYRLGVRFQWINRDELDGWHFSGQPGHPAWDNNVTTLAAKSVNKLTLKPQADAQFQMGDIIVLNVHDPATTHVRVVVEHVPEYNRLVTADYGQPGGALRDSFMDVVNGRLLNGSRWVDAWLPLKSVLEAADAAGKLEAPESAAEWAARLNLPSP